MLARFIHPISPIMGQYPNTNRKESLTNIFITSRQVRSIRKGRKVPEAYLLLHNIFDNVDFYAASKNVTITDEDPS